MSEYACVHKSVLLVHIIGVWWDVMSQSSEAADRSLLFCLLFLVFIADRHCLPAMTTPICEMWVEKTDFFFLSGSGCTIQAGQRAEILPDRHQAMAAALLAGPLGAAVAKLTAGVVDLRMEQLHSPLQNLKAMGQWAAGSPDHGPVCPALLGHQPQAKRPILVCLGPWYLARKGDNEDCFDYSWLPKSPKM